MNIESIRKKITNIIRLSEDNTATEGEIKAAVHAATKLMAKYNITRSDIDLSDQEDGTKDMKMGDHVAISHGARLTKWETVLTTFVCDFIGYISACWQTSTLLFKHGIAVLDQDGNHRKGALIYFYGQTDNAAAAVDLFEELRETIASLAKIHHGGWFRGDGASYAEGFVAGMEEARVEALGDLQADDKSTTALILQDQKNQAIIKKRGEKWFCQKHGCRIRSRSQRGGANGDPAAYEKGQKHGRNYRAERRQPVKRLCR